MPSTPRAAREAGRWSAYSTGAAAPRQTEPVLAVDVSLNAGAPFARRLEVDRRTVRRYVTMLQELGILIEGTRGRYGGFRLRPGSKLPPFMLAEDEALAVTLTKRVLGC